MPKIIFFLVLSLHLFSFESTAQKQNKQEQALEFGKEAVVYMDNGEPAQAIKLLNKARKLDEENYAYSYEIALAHFRSSNYPAAIAEAEHTLLYKDIKDECYQLLGIIYNHHNLPDKAKQTFEEGIERFPLSGALHAELGVLYLETSDMSLAFSTWTKGISVAPQHPTNYFFTTGYYFHHNQPEKAIIHGEIYRNLDPHSDRSREISALLFQAYKTIYYEHDFSSNIEEQVYIPREKFNLAKLHPVRKRILKSFVSEDKKAQNLLARLDELKEIDLDMAYDYWLFMNGDQAAFAAWYKNNEEKFKALSFWLLSNKLLLD